MNINGTLLQQELLTPLNTWHVGGPAKQTYRPTDLGDLCAFLKTLPSDEKIIWLGLGSNVLIRDAGIDGTVILTHDGLNELACDNTIIRAQAGVTCAKLAKFCAKQGLSGGCFFAGIPGTVGGALAMNAGAFGGETWTFVKAVETVNRQGQITLRPASDFKVAYRHVELAEDEWFVAAHFEFTKTDDVEAEQEKIRALLKERREKQPIGVLSCGSVFRNPPGGFAAVLIEQCGLKGLQYGDAIVSEKHANFIINIKNAKAADIEALILHVQKVVHEKTGIELIPEVKIYG
jgi:UDP-N-acetylmuramate dehydrogenase